MCAQLLLLLHERTRPLGVRFPLLRGLLGPLPHLLAQARDLRGQLFLLLRVLFGQLAVLVRQALFELGHRSPAAAPRPRRFLAPTAPRADGRRPARPGRWRSAAQRPPPGRPSPTPCHGPSDTAQGRGGRSAPGSARPPARGRPRGGPRRADRAGCGRRSVRPGPPAPAPDSPSAPTPGGSCPANPRPWPPGSCAPRHAPGPWAGSH